MALRCQVALAVVHKFIQTWLMKALGFTGRITELVEPSEYEGYGLARVIVEHRERYIVQSESGVYQAEITGNLRYAAKSKLDFPAVGDWVKITLMDSENAIILKVFPRYSVLERQAVGKFGEVQVIATNIDVAFIVQSVGHDFNLKRLERYLAICYSAGIEPVILLTKTDLIDAEGLKELTDQVSERVKGVALVPLTIQEDATFEMLLKRMEPYRTYCFIGSSGVGKSTIVNRLKGEEVLKTKTISESTSKGRHTTSHRELILLSNESIVIDTPGMREIGLTDQSKGIELAYNEISELSKSCKFKDCTHLHESGCAVLQAVEQGKISESVFENYHKMLREQEHFASTVKEKRAKGKAQGKLYKAILSDKKRSKPF